MINFHELTQDNTQKDNPHWMQIPGHSYRMLIVGVSEQVKTYALHNLMHQENEVIIGKIFLHAKILKCPKYEFLINSHKEFSLKNLKDPRASLSIQINSMMSAVALKNKIQERSKNC